MPNTSRLATTVLVVWCSISLGGCCFGQWSWDRFQAKRNASIDAVGLEPVDKGVLRTKNCRIVAVDGSFEIRSGDFIPPRHIIKRDAFGFGEKSLAEAHLHPAVLESAPVWVEIGKEGYEGFLYLNELPGRFREAGTFLYDVSIPEASLTAARAGQFGVAAGVNRWGYEAVSSFGLEDSGAPSDRLTWLLVFHKTNRPPPLAASSAKAKDENQMKAEAQMRLLEARQRSVTK